MAENLDSSRPGAHKNDLEGLGLIKALRTRWADPIEATIRLKGHSTKCHGSRSNQVMHCGGWEGF